MQWQPIETAPKDGGSILLFEPDYTLPNGQAITGEGIALAFWVGKGEVWLDDGAEGWMVPHSEQDEQGGAVFVERPTHWMPLPEPPAP